ncbi:MAG: hypothetical protein HC927_04815 [Deltaproteobacteria bacterium]|nr:hypothetical protein [Deltaproteobacteria bacterium]
MSDFTIQTTVIAGQLQLAEARSPGLSVDAEQATVGVDGDTVSVAFAPPPRPDKPSKPYFLYLFDSTGKHLPADQRRRRRAGAPNLHHDRR